MKKSLFILFQLIVLGLTYESIQNDIDRLRSTNFGQTILETIQIQLEGDSPVQNLVDMLQNLDSKIEGEQKRDEDIHERFITSCENDLNNFEGVIGDSSTQSKLLGSQIDQLKPEKTNKISNLNRKNSELSELKGELEKQTERREQENQRYLASLDELEQSLYAVNENKRMFNEYLDILQKNKKKFAESNSFLQQKNDFITKNYQNFMQVSKNVNKLKHQSPHEGVKIFLQALSSVASKIESSTPADVKTIKQIKEYEGLTKKVLGMTGSLISYVTKQRSEEDASEKSRAEAFSQLQIMLTDQITAAQTQINEIQGMLQLLNSQLTELTNEKAEYDNRVNTKQQQRDDREINCRNEQQDFTVEKAKKEQERETIQLALNIITTRLGQLKKEMMEK